MLQHISEGQTPILLTRYRELPPEKLDRIEDIADDSLAGVLQSSALPLVSGLAIAGSIASISGMPIVGILAGSYFIYEAIAGALRKGNQAQYVRDVGLVAHTLPEAQLVEYAEIVGKDAALEEIRVAYRDGQQISPAARKLAQVAGMPLQRRTVANFMDEIKQIDQPNLRIIPADHPQPLAFTPHPQDDFLGRFWEVIDRNNSFFLVGSKGSGKGMCVANLLRRKLEQYPNAVALVLDPKGDSKEDGYWAHDRIIRRSFKGTQSSSAEWNKEATKFLNEAYQFIGEVDIAQGKRLFLVFDEFLGLKANLSKEVFAEIKKFCSNSVSLGDSEGIHALLITQSFNAGDSLESEELLKNLCLIGIFARDQFDRAKKIVKFGKTNADTLTSGEFLAMVDDSPVQRVFCVGGEFMPAPKLTNYSSFDRDSGKVISVAEDPQHHAEDPQATKTAIAHCGKALFESLSAKAMGGDTSALSACHIISGQIKTDKIQALATAIAYAAPTREQFDQICGAEYSPIFEALRP